MNLRYHGEIVQTMTGAEFTNRLDFALKKINKQSGVGTDDPFDGLEQEETLRLINKVAKLILLNWVSRVTDDDAKAVQMTNGILNGSGASVVTHLLLTDESDNGLDVGLMLKIKFYETEGNLVPLIFMSLVNWNESGEIEKECVLWKTEISETIDVPVLRFGSIGVRCSVLRLDDLEKGEDE